MRQIDKLAGHLVRFAADALIAKSNTQVVVRTTSGDRASNQVLDHASVTALVYEVAPAATMAELKAGNASRFVYDGAPSGVVTIEVVPHGTSWTVTLTPGATAAIPRSKVQREVAAAPAQTADAIEKLLRAMSQKGGSDLHLSTGSPPLIRLHGEINRLDEAGTSLTSEGLKAMLWPIVPERNRVEFERRRDTDFAHEVAGLARFRGNLFMDRNGVGAVFRRIPYEIVPAEKLGLSKEMLDLCELSRGLVLVTGPTGSGKSTTLATMIDRINSNRDDHILTIEDPIEFVHPDKRCLVNQREIHVHTGSFRHALRAALREDPDVVLVGEMRDLETIEIAIETAETGHLVFGTLHTNTAPSTVDRIIDQFPADRQSQIRTMLSESLKGVIAQTLCKRVGGGRVAAYEVLLGNPAVSNIIREGKTYQLYGTMQTSRGIGMVTMGEALCDLVVRGQVDAREAYLKAVNKTEMRQLMANAGIEAPDM